MSILKAWAWSALISLPFAAGACFWRLSQALPELLWQAQLPS